MKQQSKRGFAKIKSKLLAVSVSACLGLAVVPFNAGASGVPVVDVAAISQSIQNFIAQVKQWGSEYTQYMDQYNLLKQNLVTLQSMISSFGLPSGVDLQPVSESYGIERCGSGLSLNIGSITSMLGGSGGSFESSSPREQQKQLCVAIQYMKNKRYNYVIEFLQKTVPGIQSDLNKILQQRNSSQNPGVVQGSQYSISDTNARMSVAFEEVNTRLKGYDTYIAALEDNQRAVTQEMLRGKQSLFGTVVKTAILAEALGD